jgi:hypothetical protein
MVFLTPAEKERRVKELLEQGKSTREIAEEVHMSFADIGSIRRRLFGETEAQTKKEGEITLSTDTRVFKMFEEGKSPIEVTIQLDIKSDDVAKLYRKWWELKGLELLNHLYEEAKDDLYEFHAVYRQIKDEGLPAKKVIAATRCIEQVPLFENRLFDLTNEVRKAEEQKQHGMIGLDQINASIAIAKQELYSYTAALNSKKAEISDLVSHKHQLERINAREKGRAEYRRVERIAEQRINEILSNKQLVLHAALASILDALREDPNKQLLIYDPRDGPPPYGIRHTPPGIDPLQFKRFCQAKLLELAAKYHDKLLKNFMRSTMTSIGFEDQQQTWDRNQLW